VLVLAADPNAKPVPVPNLTGSSEVLGVESAEPLPKTAPKSGFEAAAGVSFSFVEDTSSDDFVFLNFSSISFICFS